MTPSSYATFDTLRVDRPELAEDLADALTKDAHERIRHAAGFVRAHVVLSLDRTAVVLHCRWAGETGCPLDELGSPPGVAVTSVGGTETAGIAGPEPAAAPDIVAVATRHVGGPESARDLGALLVRSGTWKRTFSGFIGATAYVSGDGRVYVNYPQWTSEAAYRSYMDDPRIPQGQREIARLESAPPEFVLGRVVADLGPP
jgi:quinol monooxygenase YgiN